MTNWQRRKIGEVIRLEYGKPLPIEDRRTEGAYPAFGANGELCRTDRYYFEGPSFIVGRKGSAGEINLTPARFWPLDVTYFVTFDATKYDRLFLFYALKFLNLPSLSKGVKPGINRNDVYDLSFPFPPLKEQRRVVAILDEAFAGLDAMRASAERNLRNSRHLFKCQLESTLTKGRGGWKRTTLEAVVDATCTLSYGIVQPGNEVLNGLAIVRPTDLTTKLITLDGLKRVEPKLAGSYRRTTLHGGELLLCVRGSTGVVSIASDELAGANVTRGIVPIRFNRTELAPYFGYYLILSEEVQCQIREKTYGTALMQINIRDVRNIALCIPSLAEQQRISAKLDALTTETQNLESLYTRKLAAISELKQSLLQKAFSGELTVSKSIAA